MSINHLNCDPNPFNPRNLVGEYKLPQLGGQPDDDFVIHPADGRIAISRAMARHSEGWRSLAKRRTGCRGPTVKTDFPYGLPLGEVIRSNSTDSGSCSATTGHRPPADCWAPARPSACRRRRLHTNPARRLMFNLPLRQREAQLGEDDSVDGNVGSLG